MSTLLHLSDTHFGTEVPAVMQALQELVQQQAVQHVLLAGDITMRATRSEFAAARTWLHSLPVRSHMVLPGNHDITLWWPWERLLWPYRKFLRHFPAAFDADGIVQQDLGRIQLIGVRTTRRWRHIQGQVSPRQMDNVSRRLRALPPACLKLVAVHQPVLVPDASERHNQLRGAEAACAAWRAAGAHAVLGRHIHIPYARLLPAADAAAPLWVLQSGTAISSRVREHLPNSVNLIRPARPPAAGVLHNPLQLSAPRWQLERWDFAAGRQAFCCHSTHYLL